MFASEYTRLNNQMQNLQLCSRRKSSWEVLQNQRKSKVSSMYAGFSSVFIHWYPGWELVPDSGVCSCRFMLMFVPQLMIFASEYARLKNQMQNLQVE